LRNRTGPKKKTNTNRGRDDVESLSIVETGQKLLCRVKYVRTTQSERERERERARNEQQRKAKEANSAGTARCLVLIRPSARLLAPTCSLVGVLWPVKLPQQAPFQPFCFFLIIIILLLYQKKKGTLVRIGIQQLQYQYGTSTGL
jgi:hypothetical protein